MVHRARRRSRQPARPLMQRAALPALYAALTFAAPHAHAAGGAPVEQLGIAANHGGQFCLWSPARPAPGAKLTLLIPDQPQTIAEAIVAGPGTACPSPTTPHWPAVTLRLLNGHVPPDLALIAIPGAEPHANKAGLVLWHPPGSAEISFRSCTSHDGVHLTAWQASQRIWHGYYYVGEDLEPDCTDAETAE
jgi:hypothetical protein